MLLSSEIRQTLQYQHRRNDRPFDMLSSASADEGGLPNRYVSGVNLAHTCADLSDIGAAAMASHQIYCCTVQ
jgi:hypothetical protein